MGLSFHISDDILLLDMRINVRYRKKCYVVDVHSSNTIHDVKWKIQYLVNEEFIIPSSSSSNKTIIDHSDKKTNKRMLIFNGTILTDKMIVADIGLVSGSTLEYKYTEIDKYKLLVYVKFQRRTIELTKNVDVFSMTVGDVRVMLQNQIGIPISMFYLVQLENSDIELFDIHKLIYYNIREGDTLVLYLWKGTRGLVLSAMNNEISTTMSILPNFHDDPSLNRYLLRVALFIAAHFDHVKLAAQILQQGIRCEIPVGEHCSREWCSIQSHPDVFKTPVHQAAQEGSFECLRMFIRHSPSATICRDGRKLTPSNYAAKYKRMDCWKLLLTAQFIHINICGFSLSSHLRIMRWCMAAKERVNYFKGDARKSLLLHTTLGKKNTYLGKKNTYLGNFISIDGFNHKTLSKHDLQFHKKRDMKIKQAQKLNENVINANSIIINKQNNEDALDEDTTMVLNSKFCHEKKHYTKAKDNRTTNTDIIDHRKSNQAWDTSNIQQTRTEKSKSDPNPKLSSKAKCSHKNVPNNSECLSLSRTSTHLAESINAAKTISVNGNSQLAPSSLLNRPQNRTRAITESRNNRQLVHEEKRNSQRQTNKPKINTLLVASYTQSVMESEINGFIPTFLKFSKNETGSTDELVKQATGMEPHQLACKCLQLGESFKNKSWLQQFSIAMNSCKIRIKRGHPLTVLENL